MPSDSTSTKLYADPLVYDVLHASGTLDEIDGLIAIRDRFVTAAGVARDRWLEPACGSGRYLRAGVRRSLQIAGFDLNPEMISFTESRLPKSDVRVADMTSFAIDRWRHHFGLIFNTINTIRHLPTDEAMLAHFEQISECLAPGGAYVVGLSLSHYGHEGPSEDVWVGRRGPLKVTQIVQFEPPTEQVRTERVFSHLMIERPTRTDHTDSSYTLRSYSLRQWRSLLDRSPLNIVASVDENGGDIEAVNGAYRLFVLQAR